MPVPQRTELLRQAGEKTKILLEGLQRDQATVSGLKGGGRAFKAAVDAARRTLDNLDCALEDGSSSTVSD